MHKATEIYETAIADWEISKESIPWDATDWRTWTKWVKCYFFEKGQQLGFKAEATRSIEGCGEGEYLVDVCWWKESLVPTPEYWLELILESEWLKDIQSVQDDFYKLIDIKAFIKVWVCSWSDPVFDERRVLLSKWVSQARFKLPEEQYLILNLPDSSHPEDKDCLLVTAFWMNSQGTTNLLRPRKLFRI